MRKKVSMRFSPSICVTHNCNLNCVYCYQEHDSTHRMSLDTAKTCIDWIFNNIPDYATGVEIGFIGGEPLLEFDLLKNIVAYTCSKYYDIEDFIFFASTNGTVLTKEMKNWFIEHNNCFKLGLSIDGAPETQNANRSNSFDKIDFDFFLKNYPEQGVKMTLSEFSLRHLAENIKFVHSLGFREVNGVNLAEGSFDWGKEEYIKIMIPQLEELVDYYVANESLEINQMLDKHLYICEASIKERKKWCGIGTGTIFFDTDGKRYPCPFITPMTFSQKELSDILSTNFRDDNNFIDEECYTNCYIYLLCPTCSGANYLTNKSFKCRNKSTCQIQKLIALFAADLCAKKIIKNQNSYDDNVLYNTIEAIKKIRELYLPIFNKYIS